MADEKINPAEPDPDEPFHVHDEFTANWVVRKVVEARRYRERVKVWADQEIGRSKKDEERLLYLYGRQLEAWAISAIARSGGRRRSIALPAGRVGQRKASSKLVIEDMATVVGWSKTACPEAVTIVERASTKKLLEYIRQTGEVPPAGARLDGDGDVFFIR